MSSLLRIATRLPAPLRRLGKSLPGADRIRALLAGRPKGPAVPVGERRTVVYLPTWDLHWDVMRQRPQELLAAFARAGHGVVFVDPSEPAVRTAGGVTIVPSVAHAPRSGVILYLHFPLLRRMIDRFDDAVVVYDLLDDLSIFDPGERRVPERRRARAHHPQLLARADVVIASNRTLAERHRAERDDLLVVPNGVDAARFGKPMARPGDLAGMTRPIVGYHGMVSTWFDFGLLEAVAGARPEWSFAIVGPIDETVAVRAQAAATRPNVTFLGERPSRDMPAYVQAFDAGVIWFVVDRMTEGVTPLKMYELLAAGTPCVSTPLPAAVEEPDVLTAADAEGVVAAVERALRQPECGLRSAGAAADWGARIRPLLELLEERGLAGV